MCNVAIFCTLYEIRIQESYCILDLIRYQTRMTTSISIKAQENHGWEYGQSDLKRRCLEKNGNITDKPTDHVHYILDAGKQSKLPLFN